MFLHTVTLDTSKMNIFISQRRFAFGAFFAMVLASVIGCVPNEELSYPEPMTGMEKRKVRTYSTDLFVSAEIIRVRVISQIEDDLDSVFIDYEVYELDYDLEEGFEFDRIAEHYNTHFNAYKNWTEFNPNEMVYGYSDVFESIGWKKGKNLFLVLSLSPPDESGTAVVTTLYSEKLRPEVSQ